MIYTDDSILQKRENETNLQHHKRLVYGKLVDKTLSDFDYSELSKYVYGKELSADVARREMYGSRYTIGLVESEQLSKVESSELLSDIDNKLIELKKERQKFFDQRREFNKLVSSEGRREHLYEVLKVAAENLNNSIGDLYDDIPQIEQYYSDNEAVLIFSDWHYGMITKNIFNTYNTDICKERVKQVVDSAIQRLSLHQCRKLHIVVLGDLFHGAIHTSARVASEELVCDQLMQVSEILAQSIYRLSRYVEDTIVYMTYGNHARTVANKQDSIHRDNLERIIPWWLNERMANMGAGNVYIAEPSENEFLLIDAAGHQICASHGDLDSVKSSPKLLSTLFRKKYGKEIEYIVVGDKHHVESFEEFDITAQICGSLCGTDDYANGKRLYSAAKQLMLIVNPEIGIDAEYKLKAN